MGKITGSGNVGNVGNVAVANAEDIGGDDVANIKTNSREVGTLDGTGNAGNVGNYGVNGNGGNVVANADGENDVSNEKANSGEAKELGNAQRCPRPKPKEGQRCSQSQLGKICGYSWVCCTYT